MRTSLGCGLRLPTNFGPLLRLTRYPRVICEQMRCRSGKCRFWLIVPLLATLPVPDWIWLILAPPVKLASIDALFLLPVCCCVNVLLLASVAMALA